MRRKKPTAAPPLEHSLFNEDRTRLTKVGAEALLRWHAEMREPFSDEGRRHATWIDGNHPFAVFDKFFERRPDAIRMADGFASDVFEFERTGAIEGREPYPWQVGALRWAVFSLLQGGNSYLIEGGPGAGKTFVLGRAVRNAVRGQIAGVMDGVATVVFNKPFNADQQLFHADDRLERSRNVSAEHKQEMRRIVAYCASVLPSSLTGAFSAETCAEMIRAKLNPAAAREKIRALCGSVAIDDRILHALTCVFGGTGRVIDDFARDRYRVLEFTTKAEDPTMPQQSLFSGDMLRGVPSDYMENGWVANTILGLDVGRHVSDLSREELKKIRVLFTTQAVIDRRKRHEAVATLFERTDVVVVDDSRKGAVLFQEAMRPRLEGVEPAKRRLPLVFMASALSETNGADARPSADRTSPKVLSNELLGTIAQDVGLDVVPRDATETLYPSTARETLERAVALHFESPPLLDCFPDLQQPCMCDTVVVVNPKVVDAYVATFRAEYERRNIAAHVQSFFAMHCNQRQKISRVHSVLAWMANKNPISGPKIVVIPDHAYRDAISLPVENVLIASGLSDLKSGRIAGRLSHVRRGKHTSTKRSMIRQVLTSDSSVSLHDVYPSGDTFVPLAVVLGKEAAARDKKKTKNCPSFPVLTPKEIARMKRELGNSLVEDDYGTLLSDDVSGDPLEKFSAACAAVQNSMPSNSDWGEAQVRARFQVGLLKSLWPHFRRIRSIRREVWEQQLNMKLYRSSHSPEKMVEAAKCFYQQFVDARVQSDTSQPKKRQSTRVAVAKSSEIDSESVVEAFEEIPDSDGDDPYEDLLETLEIDV